MPDQQNSPSSSGQIVGGLLDPSTFPYWLWFKPSPPAGPPPGLDWNGVDHPAGPPLSLDGINLSPELAGNTQDNDDGLQALAGPINTQGYIPAPGDRTALARIIFSEAGSTPEDQSAVGWSVVNRVGDREFGPDLNSVIYKPGAFSSLKGGAGSQWAKSAHPELMDKPSLALWNSALATANGILNRQIPDPTDGGPYFFSSDQFDGTPQTAPGLDFPRMLRNDLIKPGPYSSQLSSARKNFFFKKNAN